MTAEIDRTEAIEQLAQWIAYNCLTAGWNDYPAEPSKRELQRNLWRNKAREYVEVVAPLIEKATRDVIAEALDQLAIESESPVWDGNEQLAYGTAAKLARGSA